MLEPFTPPPSSRTGCTHALLRVPLSPHPSGFRLSVNTQEPLVMMTLVAMALGGGGAQLSRTGPGKWREDGRRAPRRQRARTQQNERGEDSPQLTRRPARRRPPVNNAHEIKDSSIAHTPRPPVFAPLGSRVRTAVLLLPPLSLPAPPSRREQHAARRVQRRAAHEGAVLAREQDVRRRDLARLREAPDWGMRGMDGRMDEGRKGGRDKERGRRVRCWHRGSRTEEGWRRGGSAYCDLYAQHLPHTAATRQHKHRHPDAAVSPPPTHTRTSSAHAWSTT